MEIHYQIESPKKLGEHTKQYFLKLLLLQGQVAPTMEKINNCPFLCIAYDGNLPIGIGAIKHVYKAPFDYAGMPNLKDDYNYELGYIYVLDKKKYRGKKIGKNICTKLLEVVKGQKIFATTEENEENRMRIILENFNFKRVGNTYIGGNTGKTIGLYVLEAHLLK